MLHNPISPSANKMFFLMSKYILITIDQYNNKFYIGDQQFAVLPQSIMQATFASANWNRALKFPNTLNHTSETTHYYMLEVDFYVTNKQVIGLSKHAFFESILNSELFKKIFIPIVFKDYFKHVTHLDIKVPNLYRLMQQHQLDWHKHILKITHLDGWVILNPNFKWQHKQFQSLFIIDPHATTFTWKVNQQNQTIYSIPAQTLTEISNLAYALIPTQHQFMLSATTDEIPNFIIEGIITNLNASQVLTNSIITIIKAAHDPFENIHLYNLTKQLKYIEQEAKGQVDVNAHFLNLSKIFKRNLLPLITQIN